MNILLPRFRVSALLIATVLTSSSWASLSGHYLVGAGGDFQSLKQALDSIAAVGLSGDTKISIASELETGPFVFCDYPGSENKLIIGRSDEGLVTLVSPDTSAPTLQVLDSRNVYVFGLTVLPPISNQPALRISGSSTNIQFSGCSMSSSPASRAVEILGPDVRNVTLDSCSIRRAQSGVYLDGQTESASGISITNCTIDSVQLGIFLSKQTDCAITGCDIKPNLGLGGGATAISIGAQNTADSVFVSGNTLTQIKTGSGYAMGLRHNPLSSNAFLLFSNNFIFDFLNTGSSQVRAIYVSGGQNRIINNSILVNDVAASGTAYTVYVGLISPDASLTLLNNILVNLEATRTAYNAFILTQAAPVESNNNLYYGTGAAYKAGWLLGSFTTLSEWQSTGLDLSSYEGNPGFVSGNDLHVLPSSELAHQNGAVALDVRFDKDDQLRFQPPDIGADEYVFDAPAFDAAILNVLGMPQSFPEYSLLRLEVVVQNRGSSPLQNLPLRLSYEDTARAEVRVNLLPSQADTFLLLWSTASAHTTAELIIETVLPGDANVFNNAIAFDLAVTGLPMSGTYQIGGFAGDFETLSEVLTELSFRGVDGPVVLELEAGVYPENLVLRNVTGLSSASTLTIRPSPFSDGVVHISPPGGSQAALLSNVSFVTIEGLIFQGNSTTLETVRLENNSHHNVIRSCRLTCASQEQSSATALQVTTGSSENLFEQLDISTAYTGIRLNGSGSLSANGNIVRDCRISNVRNSIHASWQHNLIVEDCDIATGFANAPSPCYGIRIQNLSSTDTVYILKNRINDCLAVGSITAIACESGTGTALIANNWIADFEPTTSGSVTALSAASGTALFYHNSISINDLASANIIGVSVSGNQTTARLLNNIVQIADLNAAARFIAWTGGTIVANHNLYEGPGTNTQFRFGHSSLDGEYQTLAAWYEATGQDSASLSGQAGYQSPTDFHLRPDASGPSNRALYVNEVPLDADGQIRDSIPDIGADEFTFQSALIDLAVLSFEIPSIPIPAGSSQLILSVISNVGQLDISGARAVIYFNEVPVDSQLISILSGEDVELSWLWNSPVVDLAYGSIRVSVHAVNDAVSSNNSRSQSVVIAGPTLSDSIIVGGSRSNFGTLAELAEHLKWRGISGGVRIMLASQTHQGPLVLEAIPGADSLNRVVFEPNEAGGATITAANSDAVVRFCNAQFVEFRQIEIIAGAGTEYGISLDNMSCGNIISDCIVTGNGSDNLASVGIRIAGAAYLGNTVSNNTVSASYIGISLTSETQLVSHGNVVSDNDLSDVYYGIWVDHQHQTTISGNDIRPGSSTGAAGACYGVYILQLGENGTVRVEGNLIHGFRDSNGPRTNRACGIYSAPGITSYVEIVNNFIYGFSHLTSLRSRGIYLSSGNHLVAHNSIRLDDTPADNDCSGIFVSTGSQHEIFNNCVIGYENDVPSFGLDIEGGADVISDFNCMWGNSASFNYAGVSSQNYPSLSSWQATGQDAQSLALHAGYVSYSDLHIQNTDTSVYGQGLYLPQVSVDIDGDIRSLNPCIGADEYELYRNLSPPIGLTLIAINESDIRFTWAVVDGAAQYMIFGASTLDQLESAPTEIGSTTSTSWILDISDEPGNVRFFNVRAE